MSTELTFQEGLVPAMTPQMMEALKFEGVSMEPRFDEQGLENPQIISRITDSLQSLASTMTELESNLRETNESMDPEYIKLDDKVEDLSSKLKPMDIPELDGEWKPIDLNNLSIRGQMDALFKNVRQNAGELKPLGVPRRPVQLAQAG